MIQTRESQRFAENFRFCQGYAGMAQGLLGTGIGILGAVLASGDKPKVPDYVPIDTTKVQGDTIAGNVKNLGAAENLAGATNLFNQEQLSKMLTMAVPGYNEMMAGGSKVINDLMAGKLPDDVVSQTLRTATAKGLAGGFGTGSAAKNIGLRDLGLTSYEATSRGLSSALAWLSMAKSVSVAPQFSPSSMFVNPTFGIQTALQQNAAVWQNKWLQNQVAAEPDPTSANIGGVLATIGGSMAGSGFSGGNMFGSMFAGNNNPIPANGQFGSGGI